MDANPSLIQRHTIMQLLSSKNISEYINQIIHEDTQMHARSVDLSVKAIDMPQKPGALDFGGSEFEAAGYETIPAAKRNKDDDYGWWNLQGKMYRLIFNEELTLSNELIAIISPHKHVLEAGLVANSYVAAESGPLDMMVQAPSCGCNIKENARAAAAYLFEV